MQYNKPNAWISFTDSYVAACLVLNFTLPNTNRAPSRHPSDTSDARRRATVSRFLHAHPKNFLTPNLHRCARPVSPTPTLTEIFLMIATVPLYGTGTGTP
jgi:hypothetical protein